MPFKPVSQLTTEESEAYMKVHHATVNVLANGMVTFDSQSKTNPDPTERDKFRAGALAASRGLELLSAKFTALLQGTVLVNPPSPAQVDKAQGLAQKLAELAAAQAKAQAMVKITTDGLAAVKKLTQPLAPPAAPAPA